MAPWISVETSTAKNTRLKNSRLRGTWSINGSVASTTGTPPRSPAQLSRTRSRLVKRLPSVAANAETGRATNASSSASSVPRTSTPPSWLGNTSRPSAKNIRCRPRPRDPRGTRNDCRDDSRRRRSRGRRDTPPGNPIRRPTPPCRRRSPPSRTTRRATGPMAPSPVASARRTRASRRALRSPPTTSCLTRNQTASSGPYPGTRMISTITSTSITATDREPGLSLERERKLPWEAHPAQQRKHRRPVGGDRIAPSKSPSAIEKWNSRLAAMPAITAVPRYRSRPARRTVRAPAAASEPGRQAALEQDQHEGDRAHEVRERIVREVDPAEPVAAHRHSQPYEQEQRRQAHARRDGRGHHTGRKQAPAGRISCASLSIRWKMSCGPSTGSCVFVHEHA